MVAFRLDRRMAARVDASDVVQEALLKAHQGREQFLVDRFLLVEFLDALAAREEWREIPVIVITAKKLTAGERERLLGQARKVLEKATTTRVDIAAAIGEAIRRRHVAPAQK